MILIVGLDMVITICWKPKWYSSQVWKHQLLCSWVFLFQFAIATYKWQIQIKSLENFDCVYYYYNWNKNYSEATVRNDMGLSINSFSFRSVLDRKFVKIVSIWYSIEGPNSLLVNLLTMLIWFLCNLIHFTQGIANVSSVYLQLKFMTEKSVQTFGRKVIFIDILLM